MVSPQKTVSIEKTEQPTCFMVFKDTKTEMLTYIYYNASDSKITKKTFPRFVTALARDRKMFLDMGEETVQFRYSDANFEYLNNKSKQAVLTITSQAGKSGLIQLLHTDRIIERIKSGRFIAVGRVKRGDCFQQMKPCVYNSKESICNVCKTSNYFIKY